MPPNRALSSFLLHPPFTLPEELEFNMKVLLKYKTAQCTQLKLAKQNKQKQDNIDNHNEDSHVGPTLKAQ